MPPIANTVARIPWRLSCLPTTGPTISVLMTSKLPRLACFSAPTSDSAVSLRFPADSAPVRADPDQDLVLTGVAVLLHDGVVAAPPGIDDTASRTR